MSLGYGTISRSVVSASTRRPRAMSTRLSVGPDHQKADLPLLAYEDRLVRRLPLPSIGTDRLRRGVRKMDRAEDLQQRNARTTDHFQLPIPLATAQLSSIAVANCTQGQSIAPPSAQSYVASGVSCTAGTWGAGSPGRVRAEKGPVASATVREPGYSTVTDFARLRGWSTSQPRRTATW